ncbi:nuclear receptor subfamily 5 group A member 2-like isoform X2 [Ptychodera flava]|uniref:nuclear receptor subfamily 5 group A member 2-like isoform X2 n=1 Tax=Ptychodera flava TaxID=63121 RepID=UPI00396A76A0
MRPDAVDLLFLGPEDHWSEFSLENIETPTLKMDFSFENEELKAAFDEQCPVCGDKVSGYHYGLLTCESCKGFFKRTVQNKKVYTCIENRNCMIDKTQRKRCPYCRFQKCLKVGMKLEAVRPDRMRGGRNKFGPMYKRDRAIKQQQRNRLIASSRPSGLPGNPDISNAIRNIQAAAAAKNSTPSPMVPQPALIIREPTTMSKPILSDIPRPVTSIPPYSYNAVNGLSSHPVSTMANSLSAELKSVYTDPGVPPIKTEPDATPRLIAEMLRSEPDQKQLQAKIQSCLQSQLNMNGPTDYFSMACKLADQTLFAFVDWARNSLFFKDLKVEDQMKLLQNAWSELLVIDQCYRQVETISESMVLVTGETVDLAKLRMYGLGDVIDRMAEIVKRMRELKVDRKEFMCLKYLLLLNPDIPGVQDIHLIRGYQEQIHAALLDYTISNYPEVTEKFGQLLLRLPEIRQVSLLGEDYLYYKHLSGEVPYNSLLMEMLHSKRK